MFYGQEVGIGGAGTPRRGQPPNRRQACRKVRRTSAASKRAAASPCITKDQNASGDLGVYDLKTKTITLSGNVVVSQGQNVIHGERVVVDTVTGNARVESGSNGGAGSRRAGVRAASAR